MSLINKTVVITGGSRGIGRIVVELFAANNANIEFTYVGDRVSAEKVISKCKYYKGITSCSQVDVKEYNSVNNFIKEVYRKYSKIDILINNAGIRKDKSLLYLEKEEWDDVINTNLNGIYHMTKAVIPYMLKQKFGRIINISSISGINGLSGQTNYSSSKAGMIGFTKALAKELAGYGISVNAAAPGAVETDMLTGLSEDYLQRLLGNVPMKRLCKPMEVAKVIRFLADEDLSPEYLTGQVISIDGGMGL